MTSLIAAAITLAVISQPLLAQARSPARVDTHPALRSLAATSPLKRFATFAFEARALTALSAVASHTSTVTITPPDVPPLIVSRYRTPNGWLLRPAGIQIDTPRAPIGIALSPDHNTVFVTNTGIFDQQLIVIDANTLLKTPTPATDLYMGVAADAQGYVWASGGSRNRIFQFKTLIGPTALSTRSVGPFPGTPNLGIPVMGYPGNMAMAMDGVGNAKTLYVVGNLSIPQSASGVTCPSGAPAASPICSIVEVIDVSNPLNPSPPVSAIAVGRDAYAVVLNAAAGKLYVSNWADETNPLRANGTGTVSIVDIASSKEVAAVPVGHHPTGLALSPDRTTLFVANAAADTLSKIPIDPNSGLPVGGASTISLKPTPDSLLGVTPLAVSFSPSGDLLFVALAGANATEVLTASGDPISRTVTVGNPPNTFVLTVPHTYIPTGWYPSAMATSPSPSANGARLYVTNLKGIGAGPGPNGQAEPFSGVRTQGTVSVIDMPIGGPARDNQFDQWTATVVDNNGWGALFDQQLQSAAADSCVPAPLPSGATSFSRLLCADTRAQDGVLPTRLHVFYIVKENKTFDQYFGDIKLTVPDADADPTWILYGLPVTTNQHLLAGLFTLSDNFWADSEESTTGHSWTSAGYANDFVEITWNSEGSLGLRGNRWGGEYDGQLNGPTDSDIAEQEGLQREPRERFVDLLAQLAGSPLSFRIYSTDVNHNSAAQANQVPLGLWGMGPNPIHGGRDLDFPDTDRAMMFLHGQTVSNAWSLDQGLPPPSFGKTIAFSPADRDKFVLDAWVEHYNTCLGTPPDPSRDGICQSEMPNFIYMALPVDHTLGFNPMSPTPASMVADNDFAVGLIVEALSKTPFWKNTLIMMVEDDTQEAGDHVDSHRTFLLATGGLARQLGATGHASHQAGSLPSILKTVEALFGLPPLTVYDRGAAPLHDVIVPSLADANDVQYTAVRPPTPFLRNPPGTILARLSKKMDWRLDRHDPEMLRDLLYTGIRGWPLPDRYQALLR